MASVRSVTTVSLELLKACVACLPLATWLPRRKSRLGRPGYSTTALFSAYLLKIRENIPHDTVLERKLEENATYREFCGFKSNHVPSHDTLSRFFRKMTTSRLEKIFLRLDWLLVSSGVFDRDDLAIDATDVLSNSRNMHNPGPDAGYGYKTDGERFHGYWVVAVTGTASEIPRAVAVTPADVHQSVTGQRLFRQLAEQDLRNASFIAADSAYDDKKTYSRCVELGLVPLIDYNSRNSKITAFDSLKPTNWRKRYLDAGDLTLRSTCYRQRVAVERYQSTFKTILNGRSVPVRGLAKVVHHVFGVIMLIQLHAAVNWRLQYHRIVLPFKPVTSFFYQQESSS